MSEQPTSKPVRVRSYPADDPAHTAAPTPAKLDPRSKLEKTIEQAQARINAINAREKLQRRKDENHGAIVFAAYAKDLAPHIFDKAISDLQRREQTFAVKGNLRCLMAFKNRKEKS